jgi:tetratricopeptide (TPR) repeat protein
VLRAGTREEVEGRLLSARSAYDVGLTRFPQSADLHKAAGRLAVQLKRFDAAVQHLEAAAAQMTTDAETHYYLGLALVSSDRGGRAARTHFEYAQQFEAFRTPARLALANLAGQEDRFADALAIARQAARESPDSVKAGWMEVALLRHAQRLAEARRALRVWQAIDPTSNALRVEATRLGLPDAALWPHLAGDPERVLEVAVDYMGLGLYADALALLDRSYPASADPTSGGPLTSFDAIVSDPGTPPPSRYPLIAYYRGYCRQKAGASGRADFDAASRLPTAYVFPNRPETMTVLRAALVDRPDDATARFLLGSLYLSGGQVDEAMREWEAVRRLNPRGIPVLHRNMGLTLLRVLHQPARAAEVLREGLNADPDNIEVYLALDQASSLTGAPAADRVAALDRYRGDNAALIYKRALAQAEVGRFDSAEGLFRNRFFPREEGGINVREVYLEVRLRHALGAAAARRCDEAIAIGDSLTTPQADLPFTTDGLEPFVQTRRVQFELGAMAAACGRDEDARTRWKAASASAGDPGGANREMPPHELYYAAVVARRLASGGTATGADDAWRPRLQQAFDAAQARLDAGRVSAPGPLQLAQGLMLRALGYEAEARELFTEVLKAPDQRLSHHLARVALGESPTP